jgi:prepilin-type N-terminal cleavage/methylation domain-containing protein
MIQTNRRMHTHQTGFTLVEMAIVLMIVTILMAALIPTLSSQMDQKSRSETKKKLEEVKEALIGFAVMNGRLPCPASATSNGVEDPVGGGACNHSYDGFVPSATLGISGLNDQGYVVDGWNNRIHYAVTRSNSNAFTTAPPNGISSVALNSFAPDLLVCSTAAGVTATPSCAAGPPSTALTSSPGVPVVIYSTGTNGGSGGTSADEAENPNPNSANNDRLFVSHENTPDFDDLVIWISQNTLFNRMIAAGKLP